MRTVRPPLRPGSLGLLIPPVGACGSSALPGTTRSSTGENTFGSTEWIGSVAREAEAVGASAVWATDHLFWRRPTLECLTTLAVAASSTQAAVLGSCVLQLPLRAPAAVAKQAAALQLASGGRFVLGVGVGSHRGEYEAAGADFSTRGRRLDDGVDAMRQAWAGAGDPDGRYRLEPVAPVPVWIGGSSARARHRAARLGDGWVPLFVSPDELADGIARLRGETVAAGRDPDAVTAAVVMVTALDADADVAAERGAAWLSSLYGLPAKAFRRHLVAGPAGRCAETARRYLDAGAEHVVVMVAGDGAVDQFGELSEAMGEQRRAPVLAGVGA